MARPFPGAGTVLNALAVIAGGGIGWALGSRLDPSYQALALGGIGLATFGLGIKLFLAGRSLVLIASAIALGGLVGHAIGFQAGVGSLAESIKSMIGAQNDTAFVDVVVGTSVLYCVGTMTLLGCLQDRLEGNIEMLKLKSLMDGIVAIFFGVKSGSAMMVTACVVLAFQGVLTLAAGLLKPLARDEDMLAELGAVGGLILMAIGLGLLEIKSLPTADYIPGLVFAPLFVMLSRRFSRKVVDAS